MKRAPSGFDHEKVSFKSLGAKSSSKNILHSRASYFFGHPKKPLIALVPAINRQKSSQRYFKCDAPVLFVAVIAE
jgi:hypothetical protein